MVVAARLWDLAWARLDERFHAIASMIRRSAPQQVWSSGHYANSSFPLRAFVSFVRKDRDNQDLIIAVDFHLSEEQLEMSADISYEEGQVLAEGPQATASLALEADTLARQVAEFIDRVEKFLDGNTGLILEELESPPGE
jgi:hypothetical protein